MNKEYYKKLKIFYNMHKKDFKKKKDGITFGQISK